MLFFHGSNSIFFLMILLVISFQGCFFHYSSEAISIQGYFLMILVISQVFKGVFSWSGDFGCSFMIPVMG